MSRWYLVWLIILVWGIEAQSQIKISSKLDRQNILIGDHLQMQLQIGYNQPLEDVTLNLKPLLAVGALEMIAESPWNTITSDNLVQLQKDILITAFDSGTYVLPVLTISYKLNGAIDSAFTSPLTFRVDIVPQDSVALMPIKPIAEVPITLWELAYSYFPILLGVFLAALILLVLLLVLDAKQRKLQTRLLPPEPVSANSYFMTQLEDLQKKELWQRGEVKEYHSELSLILRNYLEQRYRIQALESTTSEILNALRHSGFNSQEVEELEWLLQTTDLVKFARTEPSAAFHEEAFASVKNFIFNTQDPNLLLQLQAAPVVETVNSFYLVTSTGEEMTLARSVQRLQARILDTSIALMAFLLLVFINYILSSTFDVYSDNFGSPLLFSILIAVPISLVVAFVFERRGASIGKRLVGLRVVNKNGGQLAVWQILIRTIFLSVASYILFVLGIISYFSILIGAARNIPTGSRVLLHDQWTNSRVISLKK